ncbi:MAG: glycosyltransferase family 39 protein, partial [Sphingobium sp.]
MNDTGGGALRRGIDIWTVILAVAIVAGAALRFWQLAEPSLAHPEIYIPGIDLLPGISEPPPRHGFFETLQWHFHAEPHPMGYYMAMWVWTSLAGTSEFALRLPGALIGIGTIWLIWRLGKDIFGREVAAVAALLLALHGFHVYWSQLARMYAPAAALAVLATWLLVLWMRSGERRPWLEAGYAATLIAGTQSVEVFWAVPFLHLAWVVLVTPAAEMPGWRDILLPWRAPAHRVMQVQAMAMALAAPEFVHAALLARGGCCAGPQSRISDGISRL